MSQSSTDDTVILPPSDSRSILPVMYAGTITVAALYFGQELMVPLVLAALLAFVLAPACNLLQRLRLPRVLSVLIVVALAFGAIGSLGVVVGGQATSLATSLPAYRTTITEKWNALSKGVGFIEQYTKGMTAKPDAGSAPAADKKPADNPAATLGLQDVSGLSLAKTLAQPLLGPLATGGIVLVFTLFILMSSEDLRDRLVRLVGRHDLHRTILAMNDAASRLSRYFLFQLALNASFGVLIGVSLWFVGLPNPLLWGILAATMRFVPFVGVVVAVVPPLLLAIAVSPGWSLALLVLALFVGSEMIMGQVIEPLIYGHSTGLSPLAVIVATAFWALLWGPVGLLIATPLTVCLVVIGRHVEALAFLDVILGDRPPLTPAETFYQRALEGQALALAPAAAKQIATTSLTDYYDKVALSGLALAQGDLARDTLAFERLEAIHAQIEALLARLSADTVRPHAGAVETASLPDHWRREGAVICIPGRGQLDDLAATMAVQSLVADGFGARMEPNLVLGSARAMPANMDRTVLCCLSMLEEGSTVSGIRYFIKRIQKQMPQAVIVVGLWHAGRDSPLLSELRAEGGDEHLVLSLGELLAFCRATAARVPAADPSPAVAEAESLPLPA
ncbi:AI-2E family transporter [Lichenihabitans psoromatis]|uniref:AI-2E family transporter n=1 Tax=Lichenihabitans psoromatis TaxID=2528642 RepID=UPI0013F15F2A|nr:AI-2E family transporter [Lichenihabitans psoromatis]